MKTVDELIQELKGIQVQEANKREELTDAILREKGIEVGGECLVDGKPGILMRAYYAYGRDIRGAFRRFKKNGDLYEYEQELCPHMKIEATPKEG